jgi:hypothetical protein
MVLIMMMNDEHQVLGARDGGIDVPHTKRIMSTDQECSWREMDPKYWY